MIIGETPYYDEIVPMMSSSYSQRRDTGDTPIYLMLQMHMDHRGQLLKEMFRRSWAMLKAGYLLINDVFMHRRDGESVRTVELTGRLTMMAKYVIFILSLSNGHHVEGYGSVSLTIMGIGNPAEYIYRMVTKRLRSNEISVRSISAVQPARFSRLTCNTHLIG